MACADTHLSPVDSALFVHRADQVVALVCVYPDAEFIYRTANGFL